MFSVSVYAYTCVSVWASVRPLPQLLLNLAVQLNQTWEGRRFTRDKTFQCWGHSNWGKRWVLVAFKKFVLGKDFLYLTPSVPAFLETLAQLSVFLASKHEHPKLRLTLFNWTSVSEELSYLGFVYLLQSIHMLIISSGWNPYAQVALISLVPPLKLLLSSYCWAKQN